jgi:hypothetical protein
MIQPCDIEAKAGRLYTAYVRAWLQDEQNFFPRTIRCDRHPDPHLPTAIRQVAALREASKEAIGYGYNIKWEEINSRSHGRNHFPKLISFDSEADLLKYTKKEREFRVLTEAATRIRQEFSELGAWVRSNWATLLDIASELTGLIEVVRYLQANPRPGCFARELPLMVDTKFIERFKPVLQEWLDLVLSPDFIRADEEHFERRYGLSYVEPPVLIRALDSEVQRFLSLPGPVVWLPLHSLGTLERPNLRIIVVENLVNLMTLPPVPNGLAIGGLGNAILLLRYSPWMKNVSFTYWGDVDAEGFEILSRLRAFFPNVRSVLMDTETICRFQHLGGKGNDRMGALTPPHLTLDEAEAFKICIQTSFRLEQERIPHIDCVAFLRRHVALIDQ